MGTSGVSATARIPVNPLGLQLPPADSSPREATLEGEIGSR